MLTASCFFRAFNAVFGKEVEEVVLQLATT